MKNFALLLLAGFGLVGAGCVHNNTSSNIVPAAPSGTFTGQYIQVRLNSAKSTYDTLRANIQLTFNSSNYGYQVTGDTTVHAGSNGTYAYDGTYIVLNDKTYPKTGVPAKPHLAGTYAYIYDGTTFQMARNSFSDTLRVLYNLTRAK